jgi:hypothetical protein
MNETQHWLQTDFDRDLVFWLLAAHYVDKYGMNASEYATAHNTTFANPVVKYLELYFLFLEYRDLGHVIPYLITHVHLQTEDPYVDWNCSDLEGPAAAPLGEALETAVAWAERGVEEIVHYFDADIYHSLTRRFDYAYEHKYGLDAFTYYRAYNTIFFEPVVAYDDHYFRFRKGMPDAATPPTLPHWTTLFILLVVSLGLGLLTITVADFLRLRPRLAQDGSVARAHTSRDAPDE